VRATAEAAGVGAAGAHQICIQVWWVTLFALDALVGPASGLVGVRVWGARFRMCGWEFSSV